MIRKTIWSIAALIGGFVLGIIVSELLAIAGLALIGPTSWLGGLRYVPFIFAALSAASIWIWLPARK